MSGFILSHVVVIAPLMRKRLEAKWTCDEVTKEIIDVLGQDPQDQKFSSLVNGAIEKIMVHTAENRSMVWGKRLRLLSNLLTNLKAEDHEALKTALNGDIVTYLDKAATPVPQCS